MIFLKFYAEAQEACDRISDQCANVGFAWQASEIHMLTVAIFIIFSGLMKLFVCRLKERATGTE